MAFTDEQEKQILEFITKGAANNGAGEGDNNKDAGEGGKSIKDQAQAAVEAEKAAGVEVLRILKLLSLILA